MTTNTQGPKLPDAALGTESREPAENAFFAGVVEAMLDGHARIDVHVQRLRELCVALQDGRGPTTADPVVLIEDLEWEIIPHFAGEELEELFGSLITDDPLLLDRIARLQAEHGELAEAFAHLVKLAEGKAPARALVEGIEVLLDTLETHEQAERTLMQKLVRLDEIASGATG